jgi:Ca2+-transporting ATPase
VDAATKAHEQEIERQANADPAPFRYRPYNLGELVDPKSVEQLKKIGGVHALIAGLGTHPEKGLDLPTKVDASSGSKVHDIESGTGASSPDYYVYAGKPSDVPAPIIAPRDERERVYGRNVLPVKKAKPLWLMMWHALADKILIILLIAAVVSLALGFYTDFGAPPEYTPCANPEPGQTGCRAAPVDWVEGLAILIAVAVVVSVGSINDYGKERQMQKLNAQKNERDVRVIRRGSPALMSVHDVQVGDVLQIEPGEIIPADGIFLRGHNVKCDESGATGESDLIRKATYEECLADWEANQKSLDATGQSGAPAKSPKRDPFLISGSRVQEGVGEYLVTSVGVTSFNGKLMMSLHGESEDTPLQAKLNHLAGVIAKLATTAGFTLFVVLFIRFLAQLPNSPLTADEKGQRFISVLILAVTVIVVAVPEGLPLAVTLALAFATKRMAKQNLLVRLLGSCETMGACQVICTDKTGTLTLNSMSVVAGSAGIHCKFVADLQEHEHRVMSGKEEQAAASTGKDYSIDQMTLGERVQGPLRELWNDSIAINSTAFEEHKEDEEAAKAKAGSPMAKIKAALGIKANKAPVKTGAAGKPLTAFVGSKTETALLQFAKDLGWEDYRTRRKVVETIESYPFSSERKAMAVVVKKPNGGARIYVKGASEVISALCTNVVNMPSAGHNGPVSDIETSQITAEDRDNIERTIMFYASQSLRTLSLAYKDFEQWPPAGATFVTQQGDDNDGAQEVDYFSIAKELNLLSIVAIEDPLRPHVRQAVADAATAGLRTIMVTGDNSLTAKSIAIQCGIYDPAILPAQVIMEGPVFRKLNDEDLRTVVPHLAVLARCSPTDKQKLVNTLKGMGDIVAVTGDGANDAAALKAANVGFSMGITGTEIAKEASDIILLDDRFSSIVTALMWGRCVRDAVRKFLQFQLSVNVGAVAITFITAVASTDGHSALGAVQLLWINLIMDTLAALALATDPATPALLHRAPERPNSALISTQMWLNIIGQAIYQMIVVLVLNFAGVSILGLEAELDNVAEVRVSALCFNTYVWCQLFNQINARRLDRGFNVFEGFFKNAWFIGILAIEVGAQVLIMFVGGAAFSVTRLPGTYWAISIVAGAISMPLAALIKLLPTPYIDRKLINLGLMPDPHAAIYNGPDVKDAQEKLRGQHWTEPKLEGLADELDLYPFARSGGTRGKRLGMLKSGWKHPMQTMREQQDLMRLRRQVQAQREAEQSNKRHVGPSSSNPQGGAGTGGVQTSWGSQSQASRFGVLMPGLSIAGVAGAWRPQEATPNGAPRRTATLADPAGGEPPAEAWRLVKRGTNL